MKDFTASTECETADADAAGAIQLVTARFYAAFDNRLGRRIEETALRSLFLPDATIFRVADTGPEAMDLDEFIAPRIRVLSDGTLKDFHEWEIAASTVVSGDLASRRSTYRKGGRSPAGPIEGGGRKLIQFIRSAEAWRIASVLWQDDQTAP